MIIFSNFEINSIVVKFTKYFFSKINTDISLLCTKNIIKSKEIVYLIKKSCYILWVGFFLIIRCNIRRIDKKIFNGLEFFNSCLIFFADAR